MDEEGGWGNVCFLSRANETLTVNLTPKHMVSICRVAPSPLTIHTFPKILEKPFYMKGENVR